MQYIIKCTLFQEQRSEKAKQLTSKKTKKGDRRRITNEASQGCSSQVNTATPKTMVRIINCNPAYEQYCMEILLILYCIYVKIIIL